MSTLSNWLPSRSTIRDYELMDNIVDNPSVSIQKCKSKKFNNIIAMKRIKSVASAMNSDWITETITEILRNRYHHNIINLLDYFIDGRDLCLIMEYLPGAKSLRYLADENARVRVDRLPVLSTSEITLVAIELIDALAYLHSRELPQSMLFHGELKPENVLVSRERIKDGTEFDKVITMSAKFKILTIPSSLVSYDSTISTTSPQDSNYCAPEVLLSKETNRSRGYSSKSDIWALGATLLNLATSFSISRSDLIVLHRYQNRSWCFEEDVLLKFSDAQRLLWDQQSSWIQDIVCSCLQLHPEQRFTARQLQGMPTYQALFSLCSVAKEDVNLLIAENHRLVESMQVKGECPVVIKSEDSGKYETLSNRKMPAAPEVSRDDDGDHDSTRSNCSSDEEEEKVQVIYSRQTENVVADNNGNKEPVKYMAPVRLNSSSYDNEVRTLAERSLASGSVDNSSVAPIDGLVSDMDIARNLARPASTRGSFGSVYSLTSGFSSIGVLDTSATSTGLPKNSSLRDLRELNNVSPLNFANVLHPATPRVEPAAEVISTQRSMDSVSKRILQGHSHYIACIAVLPDDRIVSGSYDHTIKIWNPNNGECEMTLFGHSSYVYCLTVLPNGRVVSGSWDTTLKIWNVTTGECEQTLSGHSSFVCWVVYMPDLKRIVSGDYKKLVRVWQCDDGKTFQFNRIATLPYSQSVSMFSNGETIQFQGTNLVSASPASSAVSSGSSTSSEVVIEQGRRVSPRLGDSANISPRLSVSSAPPTPLYAAAATSAAAAAAASAETKMGITPPLANSGTAVPTPTYSRMRSESLISAGIASTPGSTNKGQLLVHAYKLCSPNGNVKCSFEGHLRPITQAIRLGTNLVTSSADRTLRVWDGDSGACLAVLMGHGNEVNAVACGKNGVVVSGSNDNSVRLWDTTRYAESKRAQRYSFRHNATMAADQVLLGHQHFVSCIAVLSDGRIVSGSFDKTIIIWSGLEDTLCSTKENAFSSSFCLTASEDDREGLDDGGIPLPPVTSFQSDVPLPPFPNASFEI